MLATASLWAFFRASGSVLPAAGVPMRPRVMAVVRATSLSVPARRLSSNSTAAASRRVPIELITPDSSLPLSLPSDARSVSSTRLSGMGSSAAVPLGELLVAEHSRQDGHAVVPNRARSRHAAACCSIGAADVSTANALAQPSAVSAHREPGRHTPK